MNEDDLPFTKEQFGQLKAEERNHDAFFKSKAYQDTGEAVGHSAHWTLTFIFDGTRADPIDGREDPFRYYYAYDDPANIDTSELSHQDLIDTIHLDYAEPVEQEVGRQFDITKTNTFDSDDPLTELYEYINSK